MTKVVINRCFGGFSLSALAVQALAKRQGREAYFFKQDIKQGFDSDFIPITVEQADEEFLFYAFDIPNPNEVLKNFEWETTTEQRIARNKLYEQHNLENRPENRSDPDLVAVVEELGSRANGTHAELVVVEIPDGVDYEIAEYDGNERVHEVHRSWS